MVDYSKWKDIEISDDEDDTHPNIDTPSLFRWRHQARVERMEERKREAQALEEEKRKVQQKKAILKMTMKKAAEQALPSLASLEKELAKIEADEERYRKLEEELEKKEKLSPWNVDTISHEGFTKTVINTGSRKRSDDDLSEEERERRTKKFYAENEKLIKQYGMLKKFDDSKKFLSEHQQLVCEDTANYLVLWCINLAIEEKEELMSHVSHQVICMQFILELAKQLDLDPRACVTSFFNKIQMADDQYQAAFNDELSGFRARVKKRAEEKIRDAMEKYEEEERKKRLGPGGLDPVEVFESLPTALQQCFESKDTELLKKTISEMPEEEARYHMKRCIDSGMWIPPKDDEDEPAGAASASS